MNYNHYEAIIYAGDTRIVEHISAENLSDAEVIAMESAQEYENVWNVYVRLYTGEDDR